MQQRSRFLFSFTLLVRVSKSVAHLETGKSSSQALKNLPAHLSHRKLQWNAAGSDRKAELLQAAGDRSPHCHKRRLCKLQIRLLETFDRGPQFLLCAWRQQSVIELSDPRYLLLSLPQHACNIGQIFHSKATGFYYDCHGSQISPALADVAAGNGIRCAKVGHFINFNDVDAAGVVVERFGSLWEGKGPWLWAW